MHSALPDSALVSLFNRQLPHFVRFATFAARIELLRALCREREGRVASLKSSAAAVAARAAEMGRWVARLAAGGVRTRAPVGGRLDDDIFSGDFYFGEGAGTSVDADTKVGAAQWFPSPTPLTSAMAAASTTEVAAVVTVSPSLVVSDANIKEDMKSIGHQTSDIGRGSSSSSSSCSFFSRGNGEHSVSESASSSRGNGGHTMASTRGKGSEGSGVGVLSDRQQIPILDGLAVVTWEDGSVYEGQWLGGKRHGLGYMRGSTG